MSSESTLPESALPSLTPPPATSESAPASSSSAPVSASQVASPQPAEPESAAITPEAPQTPPVESAVPAAPEPDHAPERAPALAALVQTAPPATLEPVEVPKTRPAAKVNHSKMKLGRRHTKHDGRTLHFGKYLSREHSEFLAPLIKMVERERLFHLTKAKEIRRVMALTNSAGLIDALANHNARASSLAKELSGTISAMVSERARGVGAMAPPPTSRDWTRNVSSWPMLLNDQLEDCTIAGKLHMKQAWVKAAGGDYEPTDDEAAAEYKAMCGYNPAIRGSDSGGVMLDVLKAWVASGQIKAFAMVDPTDALQVQTAIDLFGGLYAGFALPLSAQSQDLWDVADGPSGEPWSWGGHEWPILQYNAAGFGGPTWGAMKRCTPAFLPKYCEEAYAVVSQDFVDQRGLDPDGFDLSALLADLQTVKSL